MSVLLHAELGFDPGNCGDLSPEEMKVTIETLILERRVMRSSLTNGIHLELVDLVARKLLTSTQSAYLHVVWAMGR